MSVVIDATWARAFAEDWVRAWNTNELDQIMAHYTDDFEMSSPLIVERGIDPSGRLRGKHAVGAYWGAALATAQPPVRFELIDSYAGVETVVIHYRSVARRLVTEILTVDADHRIIRGAACYGPPA